MRADIFEPVIKYVENIDLSVPFKEVVIRKEVADIICFSFTASRVLTGS